jgi:AAA15 family ATPase/GTPase
MEPVIRRLIVQGFRSIRSEVVEFDNPTFLVGRNGSGKSNLVEEFAFLSEAMMHSHR